MEKNDSQLVRQHIDGDESAFPQLVNKYLNPVYNFLYQLSGGNFELDDMIQDTFLKVWKNIKKFDQKRNFKTWVFIIAKNTAFDYFKKKRNIPFSSLIDEEGNDKLENIKEESILPDEILEREEIAKDLEEKIKELPANYRIVLLMRYQEDFSLQEVSEILGKSYNTVKNQHNRALARLKDMFGKNQTS